MEPLASVTVTVYVVGPPATLAVNTGFATFDALKPVIGNHA